MNNFVCSINIYTKNRQNGKVIVAGIIRQLLASFDTLERFKNKEIINSEEVSVLKAYW